MIYFEGYKRTQVSDRYIIKIRFQTLFGLYNKTEEYIGSGTVWHRVTDYHRPKAYTEGILSDWYTMVRDRERNITQSDRHLRIIK